MRAFGVARREIAEVVEAAFADGDDLRIRKQVRSAALVCVSKSAA
jgi:hypothetical protein